LITLSCALASEQADPKIIDESSADWSVLPRSGNQAGRELHCYGPKELKLADLGVCTKQATILTEVRLEDERILGAVHIAFGASGGWPAK
jgi:hypothetical protein